MAVPQNLLYAYGASIGRGGLERSGKPYRAPASGSDHGLCAAKPRFGLDKRLRHYSTGRAQLHPIATFAPLRKTPVKICPTLFAADRALPGEYAARFANVGYGRTALGAKTPVS